MVHTGSHNTTAQLGQGNLGGLIIEGGLPKLLLQQLKQQDQLWGLRPMAKRASNRPIRGAAGFSKAVLQGWLTVAQALLTSVACQQVNWHHKSEDTSFRALQAQGGHCPALLCSPSLTWQASLSTRANGQPMQATRQLLLAECSTCDSWPAVMLPSTAAGALM
jgi:hypothetical protein